MHQALFRLTTFPLRPAHLEICWCRRARSPMRIAVAICIHHAEIVLRMLIQVFGRNPITARCRLACERDIALEHLVSVAADLYVRTIAIKGLDPMRHPRAVMMGVVPVIAAARSFVWSWSHDTCLIAVDNVGPLSGGSVPLSALGRVTQVCRLSLRRQAPKQSHPRRERGAFQPFFALKRLRIGRKPSALDSRSRTEGCQRCLFQSPRWSIRWPSGLQQQRLPGQDQSRSRRAHRAPAA